MLDKMNAIKAKFVEDITNAVVKYTEANMELLRSMKISDLASEDSPLSVARPAATRPAPASTRPAPSAAPSSTSIVAVAPGPRFTDHASSTEELVKRIVSVLQANPKGLPTIPLRQMVHASQSDYAKAINAALAYGILSKRGHKRATKYALKKDAAVTSATVEDNSPTQEPAQQNSQTTAAA